MTAAQKSLARGAQRRVAQRQERQDAARCGRPVDADASGLHLLARPAGPAGRALGRARSTGSTRPRATLPDAAEWWYERRTLIRQLLGARRRQARLSRRPPATPTAPRAGWSKRTSMPAGSRWPSSTTRRPRRRISTTMTQALDAAGLGDAGQLLARPRPARRSATTRRRQGGVHGRGRLPARSTTASWRAPSSG